SFLQYAIPVALLGVMIILFPVSRVVWLAIDVLLRPVERSELMDPIVRQPASEP
ncbi:MAG: hypothetical protein H7247_13705, partial [Polaromonas sp.]|nr:hypothetical protein [Gemmatimonadaceae bacterium]